MIYINIMGLWNFITKAGRKLWNGIKKPVSTAYHWIKDGMSSLHNVGSWIDNKLSGLSGIPIIGELADLIRLDPLYQEIGAVFNEAEGLVDLAGHIGRDVGSVIEAGLGSGGSSRPTFRPLPVSPVSGGISASNQLTERSVPNVSPVSGYSNSFAIS